MSIGNTFPPAPAKPYAEIRKIIRDGDVLLCSGNGTFSAMIQAVTDSVWSHVGLILRLDSLDRVMLLESVEPIGVRTVRLSKYLQDYDGRKSSYTGGMVVIRHRQFSPVVTDTWLRDATKLAIDQFGRPYDKADIARIAGRIMSARIPFGPEAMAKMEPNEDFICSEYVGMFYAHVGLPVPFNRLGFLAPSDFAESDDFELVAVVQRP